MKRRFFLVKGIALLFILAVCLKQTNKILLPKYTSKDGWPTTSTFLKFYDLEKDTVEVLFLGSSHMVSAVNPIQIDEEYGINSYNLGSEQQSIFLSYYWLREALRYQNPQIIVLDCYFLDRVSYSPFNTEESFIRKSIDYMKWSDVKQDAVDEICSAYEDQTKLSYYLTNIRFHERWKSLTKDDFASYEEIADYDGLNGYKILTEQYGENDYIPVIEGTDSDTREFADPMKRYLDKIRELCDKNNMELILIMTPYKNCDIGLHNAIMKYSNEYGIPFYDFNEEKLYDKINYNFEEDNSEVSHVNENGALKITSFLGELLNEKLLE